MEQNLVLLIQEGGTILNMDRLADVVRSKSRKVQVSEISAKHATEDRPFLPDSTGNVLPNQELVLVDKNPESYDTARTKPPSV